MPYKKQLLKKLKGRPFVSYEELNRLLPKEIISPEKIEEVLEFLDENRIRVVHEKEPVFQMKKGYRDQAVLFDEIDTPDKFYFYELNKTLSRNREKEQFLLKKLETVKRQISGLIIDSDFFCYHLHRWLVRASSPPPFYMQEQKERQPLLERFRILFRDYSSQNRKAGSRSRKTLIRFLGSLSFKFRFILESVGELRQAHERMKASCSGPGAPRGLELLEKKAKTTLGASAGLLKKTAEALAKYEILRNEFILAYTPVVLSLAGHYNNQSLNLSDLIQEGNLALVESVDLYSPSFHKRGFYAFASDHIRLRMRKALLQSRMLKSSKEMEEEKKAFLKTTEQLKRDLEKPPTLKQVQEALKWDDGKMTGVVNYLKHVESLDREDTHEETTLKEALEETRYRKVEDLAIDSILREKTLELIGLLKPQEQAVIKMRFGFNIENRVFSSDEIARLLNLSEEIVGNIEEHSLKKLKVLFESHDMKGFL